MERQILRRIDHNVRELLRRIPGEAHRRGRFTIHVVEVELKLKEDPAMPQTDHMPPIQLPASTLRAKLQVVDPRKADGTRVTSVSWTSSDNSQVALEAIADDVVKDADGNPVLDTNDQQPLNVFSVFADTPLDSGKATITVSSAGMADCDIVVGYSDPPVGHFAISATAVPEA